MTLMDILFLFIIGSCMFSLVQDFVVL